METINCTSYASNGNNLGTKEATFDEGTFESLKNQTHPALAGLEPHKDAARWDFYCIETGEILAVNKDGIVSAR